MDIEFFNMLLLAVNDVERKGFSILLEHIMFRYGICDIIPYSFSVMYTAKRQGIKNGL